MQPYRPAEMTEEDWFLLKGFEAAKIDVDRLTLEDVNYQEIQRRLHTSWPL